MSTPGHKAGWFYDCLGEKTYPAQPHWDMTNSDDQRLEFLLTSGLKVSSICAGDHFFISPLTGYFSTPRLAVDCAMDIRRQQEWRCHLPDCLTRATYRITNSGRSAHFFKVCTGHMEQYRAPDARHLWTIEDIRKWCPKHPTYRASMPPRSDCEPCWKVWRKIGNPPPP